MSRAADVTTELIDTECLTCEEANAYIAAGEPVPEGVGVEGECPKSERPCGHHCNCSWIHDCCHWCGVEFGEAE